MTTLFIIPAHNEAKNLPHVVQELVAFVPGANVLVVDDGSTDETAQVLRTLPVQWLRFTQRRGVGSAVRAGLRFAARNGFQTAIRVDADGQHPPDAAAQLLASLDAFGWEVAAGSRYLSGDEAARRGVRFWVQRALGACLSALTGRRVTDPTSGLWAFGSRAIRLLAAHHPTGYSEPELRLLLIHSGLRVGEMPVHMRPRLNGQTTLTPSRAMVAVGRALLAMLLVPLRRPLRDHMGIGA